MIIESTELFDIEKQEGNLKVTIEDEFLGNIENKLNRLSIDNNIPSEIIRYVVEQLENEHNVVRKLYDRDNPGYIHGYGSTGSAYENLRHLEENSYGKIGVWITSVPGIFSGDGFVQPFAGINCYVQIEKKE